MSVEFYVLFVKLEFAKLGGFCDDTPSGWPVTAQDMKKAVWNFQTA
jgi:hypothetical protein